ncbi:MAG: ABC transporter permease subunit [Chloroflexi bacterium]|nr:ABC transporter permease subunit [Chloroflexota bacterium]MDL1883177.1 ABC transporter permease subunit [Anaerolineae bacterium CFX8]
MRSAVLKKFPVTPYLLLLPSMIYLVLFFAYPMVQSLQLALRREGQFLHLRAEPAPEAAPVGTLEMQTEVRILDRLRTEEVLPNGRTRPIYWFQVEAEDAAGSTVQGWVSQSNVFIESRTESTTARVVSGETTQEWTLDFLRRMVTDFRFGSALGTTILLIALILPLQFVLAIVMALVLQSQIRGSTIFLYIFTLPLGISDLASGILWYSIFTQRGFLNSFLVSTGLLDQPFIFIQAGNQGWMIAAIVLAEVWRATSIVMVIVVSGLQAISRDVIEAGEVFGANLWQRLRYIILPMLKPSLQVALILRTILAFQVFAVVVALTGGNVITVLANETYRWYDPARFNNPNVAASYAGFIMLLSLGISMFYLRAVRSQEEAEKAL